ncbi:MAG: addiction module protein [Phycisphaeraceae bacterium]
MTALTDQLKSQLLRLPVEDRAELAHLLLVSLPQDEQGEDSDFDPVLEAELERRAEELRTGKVPGTPIEDVLARVREKHA